MATTIDFDIKGIDGVLDLLSKLPAEVVSKRGGPVKAALRTGAKVIDAARRENLKRVISNQTKHEDQQNTGLLLKSLIVSRGKAPTGGNGERVVLRVKRNTYPRKGGKAVTTLKTAALLEYGSGQQPAEPWIRPAFNATATQAVQATTTDLVKRIDRIVKKLAKTGGR